MTFFFVLNAHPPYCIYSRKQYAHQACVNCAERRETKYTHHAKGNVIRGKMKNDTSVEKQTKNVHKNKIERERESEMIL